MIQTLICLLLSSGAHAAAYPIVVRGADEASYAPVSSGTARADAKGYDVAVIGGGLSGLSAALYLTDHGKSVLLLEKEEALGGLAFGGVHGSANYGRGAAYWTSAFDEELKILERIGMASYKEDDRIYEPSDSFLWNGRLYLGLWEDETLRELPASFALFKSELTLASKAGLIPNQPLEEAPDLLLDSMTADEWVRRMPLIAASRTDEEAKKLYRRFLTDPAVDRADPMAGPRQLLDLYCRSALGATTDKLSALAFANFYISEIEPRYTTVSGTGDAARHLEALLRARSALATIKTGAAAYAVETSTLGVVVSYAERGMPRSARASYAVYAAQLKFAPKLIQGFSVAEPERAKVFSGMDYAHFSVHAVFVDGHPFRATYDTWTRAADYRPDDFTDVILGRWMDPRIKGYEGLRDFKQPPPDQDGVLTVYHPLELGFVGGGYTRAQAEALAERAVGRLHQLFDPLLKERWGTSIAVRSVETNRWPYSIHIARPGHFAREGRLLRKPYGRVFFANNNIGTPAFEEALFRGHCAADNILKRLDPAFQFEAWTQCPEEKE